MILAAFRASRMSATAPQSTISSAAAMAAISMCRPSVGAWTTVYTSTATMAATCRRLITTVKRAAFLTFRRSVSLVFMLQMTQYRRQCEIDADMKGPCMGFAPCDYSWEVQCGQRVASSAISLLQ